MIITRTPLRISFAGGGTDLPAFYRREPGAVVSSAIDKYIYITVNKKFDHKIRASYSITEIVDTIEDLKHELIRAALRRVGIDGGIEITSISDIPSQGTGLGSSSTYTVGLLNALYAFAGRLVGAERLAREACHIEIDVCGKPIGNQDQYIAAYGGLKFLQFNPDDTVEVSPVLCSPETRARLESCLLLLYTGLTRSADSILEQQSKKTCQDPNTFSCLRKMRDLAVELRAELSSGNLAALGEYLHQGWAQKRGLVNGISNNTIDHWYETALLAGASGGKVLGAGGGGFLLLYTAPERREDVLRALPGLQPVPFHFEPLGSKIIYVEE